MTTGAIKKYGMAFDHMERRFFLLLTKAMSDLFLFIENKG
jgi:hypothetical protein